MIKKQHGNLHILLKFRNIKSSNKSNMTMLRSKGTTIISEINDFFTSNEKVCQAVLWMIRSLNLNSKQLRPSDGDRSTNFSNHSCEGGSSSLSYDCHDITNFTNFL